MVVSLFLLSLVISLMDQDFTHDFDENAEHLIPSDVMVEISPSSSNPNKPPKPIIFKNPLPISKFSAPPIRRLPTPPKDQVLRGNIVPKLDYTCHPPRHTGLFLFSGGIQHGSRPFLPIQHSGFRYVEELTPEQILAGTGVFIPRVPIPAKMGKKHLIRNGAQTSNKKEKIEKKDDCPEVSLEFLCLPEDWTY